MLPGLEDLSQVPVGTCRDPEDENGEKVEGEEEEAEEGANLNSAAAENSMGRGNDSLAELKVRNAASISWLSSTELAPEEYEAFAMDLFINARG